MGREVQPMATVDEDQLIAHARGREGIMQAL